MQKSEKTKEIDKLLRAEARRIWWADFKKTGWIVPAIILGLLYMAEAQESYIQERIEQALTYGNLDY